MSHLILKTNISRKFLNGLRCFSSSKTILEVTQAPKNTSIPASMLSNSNNESETIDVKERFNSLVSSYEEIGTIQTQTTPFFENQPEDDSSDLTLNKMLAAGLHLGSSTELWNPRTLPFIFGTRSGINIFNLEVTMSYLRRACAFTREVAYNNGIILFLSSKPEFAKATVSAAQRCNSYYVYHKWVPGTISNRDSVLGSKSFVYYEGEQHDYKTYKPDLLIVANLNDNKKAVAEATRYNIPTIGIVDSDMDPALVTYPIPGNDDSVRSIEIVLGLLSTAAREGTLKREKVEMEKNEKVKRESRRADLNLKVKPTEEEPTFALEP